MADDNVVRPVFGRKKSEPDKPAALPKAQDSLSDFVRDATGGAWAGKFRTETQGGEPGERDIDMAGFSTIIGTFDVSDVLSKLVQRHEGKIREYRSLVEGYSDEDLQAWLAHPKDSDLQRKPYFFHALIDEAKRRFLRPEERPAREEADDDSPSGYQRSNPSDVSDDYKDIGPLEGEALARAQKDLMYMLANQDFVNAMRNKLQEAGDTIFSLTNFVPDQESIRLRRQGLKTYSLGDICKEVEKTHQLQWRKQPSYLGALTLEHHYRVQVALSLMNKEDPAPE